MMNLVKTIFLSILLFCGALSVIAGAPTPESLTLDRKLLKEVGIGSDTESLLTYLKNITPTTHNENMIDQLIKQLGAATFKERRLAEKQLLSITTIAASKLEAASRSDDPEVKLRATRLLEQHEENNPEDIMNAILAVLQADKPKNALDVLMGVMPVFMTYTHETAVGCLSALVTKDDRDTLIAYLKDDSPLRRMAAIRLLTTSEGKDAADLLKPLLSDTNVFVQLEAAYSMINIEERQALPVFVALLEAEDDDIRMFCGEALRSLTGQNFGLEDQNPKKRIASWKEWINAHGESAELKLPLNRMFASIQGSSWVIEHGENAAMSPHIITFMADGALSFSHGKGSSKQTWNQIGNKVVMEVNNKFVIYTGYLKGPNFMEGMALNMHKREWTWRARRGDKLPPPKVAPKPQDPFQWQGVRGHRRGAGVNWGMDVDGDGL